MLSYYAGVPEQSAARGTAGRDQLEPFGGFAAETAGAITLMGTAHFDIAVRTTHTLLGAGIFHLLAALLR